ncbi:MAG: hypothetical protein M1819_002021 [Sarea resinae]|nr:MAG: hypothetical protein M1819_002021 [Sarea resinae]
MASTATAAPSANGTSANASLSSTPPNPPASGNGRPQFKTMSSSKSADASRKTASSPFDGAQRKPPTQNAWAQGTNPITQRPSHYDQQNGVVTQTKGASTSRVTNSTTKESNTPEKHANDRLLFLMANFLVSDEQFLVAIEELVMYASMQPHNGLDASITVKNGDKFTGIFSGATLETNETSYVLKMVKKVKAVGKEQANGVTDGSDEYLGTGDSHAMTFEIRDVIDLAVEGASLTQTQSKSQNGMASKFKTDSDISGNFAMPVRNLQRWEPADDSGLDLSLESGGNTGWDQFEANERLYGVKSDYDENIYTTAIDRSNPLYKQRAAEAERIAREIEGQATANVHLAEERGLRGDDTGIDEEERYSGVHRGGAEFPPLQSGPGKKYTPPARRPPTGQPTVSGAPVDPAIISSQIARPDPSAKKPAQDKSVPPVSRQEAPSKQANEQVKKTSTDSTAKPDEKPVATTVTSSETVPSIKGVTDAEHKSTNAKTSGPSVSASPNRTHGGPENATANVETELLDSFKQFANSEKMRVQERRRNQASHDKAIKLNDLMKFSKNFKLMTPVPKDLVPILAKDKTKQEEIIEKARRNAEAPKSSPGSSVAKPTATPTEQKTQRPAAATRYDTSANTSNAAADRQSFLRGRQGYSTQAPYNNQTSRGERGVPPQNLPLTSPRGPGLLSQRLANIQQQNRAGGALPNVPSPLPIQEVRLPPTGPAAGSTGISSPQKTTAGLTPTSAMASKFNVKALEFKPNPAASAFTPTGNPSVSSSPRSNTNARPTSRVSSPSSFFGNKKPLPTAERPSINDHFSPIKRLKKEAETEKKDYAFNGDIKPAYTTKPTWDVAKENENKSYKDMFDRVPSAPPSHTASPHPPLPHQHQLPFHLQQGAQGVPQVQTPHAAPQHLQPQPHYPAGGPHHFDDHRMHASASSSSMFPSPRLQQINLAYPSPMSQHAQLATYGQPMPQYAMGPGGPQIAHVRQYPGGPQFVNPQGGHIAPMMVHQQSGGPFMGVPQGIPFQPHMYSPAQAHAYPGGPPPQGTNGYPSPGRGAPMMIHQGSQQGQPPQQMMWMSPAHHGQPMYAAQQPGQMTPMRGGYPPQQSHFASSPHQPHHFPPQPHRAGPNGNYGQGPPPPHAAGQQVPPPTAAAARTSDGPEDAK